MCIAQVLKDDLATYWTKLEVKTTLHHDRIIMKHVSELQALLVAKRHAEVLATEGCDEPTEDERDAVAAGAPMRTPKPARKRKSGTPQTKKTNQKPKASPRKKRS